MNRIFTVSFENVAVAAAQDLFYIAPADDKPVIFHAIYLSNVGGTADAGDAQEELLRLALVRGHATVGSGGTAPTPQGVFPADASPGFTARVNDTTIASAGTPVNLHPDGWNTRIPYQMIWTPETRPMASQGQSTIVFRLLAAPADSFQVSGTLYLEEVA